MTQPPGGLPGHPEPEPAPGPEPEPPAPIPPPDPAPPEPPHEHRTEAAASLSAADDFIDAPPPAEPPAWPPVSAFADESATAEQPAAVGQRDTEIVHPGDQQITEPVATWHQPPPSGPWHARHERPGEWHTTPPDHLAYQHSPPAHVEDQQTEIVHTPQQHPWQVPLQPDPQDRRRRTGLWLSVALTTTVLLCGGGAFSAYLLLRDADGAGAPDPGTAVNEFLTAVYTRHDATAAQDLVCREARDSGRLSARVEQIKGLSTEYEAPTFRWSDPAVASQSEERATVSVQLTLTTDDEKTADQELTFTTVRKTGWLVCEISG